MRELFFLIQELMRVTSYMFPVTITKEERKTRPVQHRVQEIVAAMWDCKEERSHDEA